MKMCLWLFDAEGSNLDKIIMKFRRACMGRFLKFHQKLILVLKWVSTGSFDIFECLDKEKTMFDIFINILVADIRCVFWNRMIPLCTVKIALNFCPLYLSLPSSSAYFLYFRCIDLKCFSSVDR